MAVTRGGMPENVFLTTLDAAANWARSNSLWPMPFATACCGIELMATASSRHDLARFGEWSGLPLVVKGILRAEMTRRAITYDKLTEILKEQGVNDTAVNIRNKVARGGFSAAFFLQCLTAIGCKSLQLGDA